MINKHETTIFRVELKDDPKSGMYRGRIVGDTNFYFATGDGGSPIHLPPHKDIYMAGEWKEIRIIHNDHNYYFGFDSIEQAKTWLCEFNWLFELEDLGFHVVEYKTTDYIIDKTQACFRMDTSIRGVCHSLSELVQDE
jgi:hypothetical protein